MAESSFAALARRELRREEEPSCLNLHDDELADSISPMDFVGRIGIEIYEHRLYLSSITRVDQTRSVEAGNAVINCQAAAGEDESRVALRDRHAETGRNERSTAARGEDDIPGRDEIRSSVSRMGIGRRASDIVEHRVVNIDHWGQGIA